MGKLKVSGKPFDISKREVWEAYEKVKASGFYKTNPADEERVT